MAINLKVELQTAGYVGDGCEWFRELVVDTFHGMFRAWTDEQLLCTPREALHYCNRVRMDSRLPDLPDSVILRTLTNLRKRSRIAKAST